MRLDDPRHEAWRDELRRHQREIERLRVDIALLQRDHRDCAGLRDIVRIQIEFANAQITRHQISAELMQSRLRALG